MKTKLTVLALLFVSAFLPELHAQTSSTISSQELPEYVIITAENTKLLGGIGLTIDWKKSPHKESLEKLYTFLQSKKEQQVRTIADLLNVMYDLGFEYVNSFGSSSFELGGEYDVTKKTAVDASDSKHRNNIVFKKRKQ